MIVCVYTEYICKMLSKNVEICISNHYCYKIAHLAFLTTLNIIFILENFWLSD